jgi:hypothetical protein
MDPRSSSSDFKRAAIILAGGDGRRLAELTSKMAGFQLSKQFCPRRNAAAGPDSKKGLAVRQPGPNFIRPQPGL